MWNTKAEDDEERDAGRRARKRPEDGDPANRTDTISSCRRKKDGYAKEEALDD